jgi:hypothetical protein
MQFTDGSRHGGSVNDVHIETGVLHSLALNCLCYETVYYFKLSVSVNLISSFFVSNLLNYWNFAEVETCCILTIWR